MSNSLYTTTGVVNGTRVFHTVALDIIPERTERGFIPASDGVPAQSRVFHKVWNRDLDRHDLAVELVLEDPTFDPELPVSPSNLPPFMVTNEWFVPVKAFDAPIAAGAWARANEQYVFQYRVLDGRSPLVHYSWKA